MNRFLRRLRRFGRRRRLSQEAASMEANQRQLDSASTPPDVSGTRAKSQVHGKVTADKWNQ